jgi:Zn ribbon nucleic-acid-binding protein
MNIDQIINMRAEFKAAKGLNKIAKSVDFYSAMKTFLDSPICPNCKTVGTTTLPIHPGIDGVKCSKCFHNGIFVNLVRRKDLMKNRDELLVAAKRLVSLLEENETGCFTWHQFVHERIDEINLLYSGKKEKEKPKNWEQIQSIDNMKKY